MYLIDLLENEQRNFTTRFTRLCNLNYINRLGICNIESLELRRIRLDMCFIYKFLHNLVKCNLSEFILVSSNIHNTKGNCFKLKKTHAHLIIRLNHFVIRCVNNWNILNYNILYSYSFTVFKKCLQSFDKFII